MFEMGHHLTKPRMVFGCGNPLFGDDGFGARVIEYLSAHHHIPDDTACVDIGTAIRDLLFDILLSPTRPRQILIVDAMEIDGGVPGQLFEIDVSQIHPAKISDFSLHQFPTTNMLKEIREHTDIDVRILVVHPTEMPPEIRPGLSPEVTAAVPEMCQRIMTVISTPAIEEQTQGGKAV
jgi:coenzyme F420 hydrogenase subunit delta